MSLKAGWNVSLQTYRQAALAPFGERQDDWDAWEARVFRYLHGRHYYHNTAYSSIAKYASQQKEALKLYANIRPIYNPVYRLVNGYVANIWGGNLDFDTLEEGAIPLLGLDEPLRVAIRQLWRWSNWDSKKNLCVRQGAMIGDSPVKVVGDVSRGKVRFEILDPMIIQEADFDPMGNLKAVLIGYLRLDEAGREYLYQERITGESFATFKDGKPHAYPDNQVYGQAVAQWTNPYGFVPLVNIPHSDIGKRWGGSAYASVLPKIDELNDQASKTNDFIRIALNPVWYAAGVQGPDELEFQEADEANGGLAVSVVYGPPDSHVTPMVATADLAAGITNLDHLLAELNRDLPELALPDIREKGDLTAPGVRAGFSDAIARYVEARGQYNDGLVRLHMMGISIGAYHRFEGFEPFSLDSYAAGNLEHSIKERPVIEDTLSKSETLTGLQTVKDMPPALAKLALKEMGYDEVTITEVVNALQADQEARVRSAVRGFAEGVFGDQAEEENDGDDPEEA
jgi:hypothetical protein